MERISLSNSAFEGNNNVFVFTDGSETVLIDTGDRRPATRDQLNRQLASRGLDFADIDSIFLTHWHGDHTGLAGEIQADSGADVYVHREDLPLVEGDEEAWNGLRNKQKQYFDRWGIPDEKRTVVRDILAGPESLGEIPEATPFEGGDVFSFDRREFEVVHAPGHAAGLSMFETEIGGQRGVFSGDALLPVYTPNVGGADVRVDCSLAKYLRTLTRIVHADYDRAWPGHRDPIDDPSNCAMRILRHHEERAYRVLDTLARRGPCTTWTVSVELFGELDGVHALHGPGEAHAHLEHLEDEGTVVRKGGDYRLTADVKGDLEALKEQRWPLEIEGDAPRSRP